MTRNLLVLYIILLSLTVSAQERKPWAGFGIETSYMPGRAFKHTKKIIADFPSYSPTYDVNFVVQTNGRKDWQQRRRYPVIGMGIAYTVYDDDVVYGKCISLYPNLRIPIISGKKLEWSIKAGFGLGYITKKFERYPSWDTLNTAMSSHVNNYTLFQSDLRYRVNEHWDILAGAYFTHVSNAALRAPNLGINKYGAVIGVRYSPVTSEPKRIVNNLPKLKNRMLLQLRFGMSGSEMGTADGPMNPIYSYTAYLSKRYWGKNKMMLGADYTYHKNIYQFLKNNEISPGKERANSWKGAVFIGNEFLLGRIGIMFQLGYYFHKDMLTQKSIYQKLGGIVYLVQNEKGFLKELSIHSFLKAHSPDAELVELGIGAAF